MPRHRHYLWDRYADWTAERVREAEPAVIAFDSETTGVGFYDTPFCFTLSWRNKAGEIESGYIDTAEEGAERRVALLGDILRGAPALVAHNLKFDAQKGILAGVFSMEDLQRTELHDTQTIYTLIDENGRKGLKYLAATVLKIDNTVEVKMASGPNKGQTKRVPREEHELALVRRKLKLKKEDGYHLLPRTSIVPYALKDTEFTLLLFEKLLPRLEKIGDPRLLELYREFMDLKLALLDMEADGLKLDMTYLNETASEYGVKVMEGWDKIVTLTGNPELNPQSPAQIVKAFADRGVVLESTAESVLRDVSDELAGDLLQYRSDKKIHTTYLVGLQHEQREGLTHPSFNDDAARTGRMSSSTAFNN
jgi:DNA polymerase I-like protein with 3'-5' exonuclease and polymerase domains